MTSLEDIARRAFAPVAEAVRNEAIPGAALGIVDAGGITAIRSAGNAEWQPTRTPLTPDMLFDLASLTKVLLTAPAVMKLAAMGRVDLDRPLSSALADMNQAEPDAPARAVTVRDLLSHSAGLPAWAPIYTYGDDPARLKAYVLQHRWPVGPPVYSDIGYILLGILVERLTGQPLELLFRGPELTARPESVHSVATERCPWRGRVMRGQVHDENAYALGGLAGHAGLFGTIGAVMDAARGILTGQGLGSDIVDEMARPVSQTHGLGWQVKHPDWSGGQSCSSGTIGHLGFTGTGLWIDRQRGLAWALLTNRVHPSRHRATPIMDLRRQVGEAVCG